MINVYHTENVDGNGSCPGTAPSVLAFAACRRRQDPSHRDMLNINDFVDTRVGRCYHSGVLRHILSGLCDLIYPPHCFSCQKYFPSLSPTGLLCPPCERSVPLNRPPFCPKCSRHLKSIYDPRCRQCTRQARIHFDFAWAACLYEDPLKQMITRFKYRRKPYLAKYFARLMVNFLEIYRLDIAQFDIIIPIPLFPARLRERGYNQSLLLADLIARQYDIDVSTRCLARIRPTQHQTALSEKDRWTNMEGAFRIMDSGALSGKNILLIDDLLTTGATASQAARELKKADVNTVGVLTLAITA